MKINKLKCFLIAVFCGVIPLRSETQCMEEDWFVFGGKKSLFISNYAEENGTEAEKIDNKTESQSLGNEINKEWVVVDWDADPTITIVDSDGVPSTSKNKPLIQERGAAPAPQAQEQQPLSKYQQEIENAGGKLGVDEEGETKPPMVATIEDTASKDNLPMGSVPGDKTSVKEKPSEPQTLSIYQQAIFEAGMKDKVSFLIWKYLGDGSKQNLALVLKTAIEELDQDLLKAPGAVVNIGFITTSKVKLAIGKNRLNKFYDY